MSEDIAFANKISKEHRTLKIYIPAGIVKKYGLMDGMYVEIHMYVIKPRERTISKTSDGKTIISG